MAPAHGDLLLEKIALNGTDEDVNELLKECQRGYPVAQLRRLLRSPEHGAVKAGAWIVSELGERALPLLSDIVPLLHHPVRYVRFFVLDAILAAAKPEHADAIANAIMLIRDADNAVRWKALHFIAKATLEQLRAAQPRLVMEQLAAHTAWFLDVVTRIDGPEIAGGIDDSNPTRRLFAVAAAARTKDHDIQALEKGTRSADQEVSSFALQELERLERNRQKRGVRDSGH